MAVLPTRATITPLAGPIKGQAIAFHGWKGWVGEMEDDLDFYRRPGSNGNGVQTLGMEHFKTCQTWRQELNAATAEAWILTLQFAKGPAVTLKDAYGRTLKRCRIHTIDYDAKSGRGGQVNGGNATMLITASLMMERLPDG